jgi:hypothetical protein
VRKAFATTTAMSGLSVTIAGSGPTYTVARASGSFITDGVKAGDVVRLTAGSFNAANLNKNLLRALARRRHAHRDAAERRRARRRGPDRRRPPSRCRASAPGCRPPARPTTASRSSTGTPTSAQSELFTRLQGAQLDIALPPTGMGTIGLDFLGGNVTTAAASTTPRRRPRPPPADGRRSTAS